MIENLKKSKIKLAWFTPCSSSIFLRSIYFSKMVVTKLSKIFDIDIYSTEYNKNDEFVLDFSDKSVQIKNYLTAFIEDKQKSYDLYIYNLEDSKECEFIRLALGLRPGITIFHDIIFETNPPESLIRSPWKKVIEKYFNANVELPEADFTADFDRPFALREASLVYTPIFTNPWARLEFQKVMANKSCLYQGRDYFIPIPLNLQEEVANKELVAEFVKEDSFTIAISEGSRIESRAHKILEAISSLGTNLNGEKNSVKICWMVDSFDLSRCKALCNEFNISNIEFIIGKSPDKWRKILKISDVAVHTRNSIYLTASPYLEQSLLNGLHVIVSKFGVTEYVNDSLVFKIEPSINEVSQFRQIFKELINLKSDNTSKLSMSLINQKNGQKEYISQNFDIEIIIQELIQIFKIESALLKTPSDKWNETQNFTRRELFINRSLEREPYSIFGN